MPRRLLQVTCRSIQRDLVEVGLNVGRRWKGVALPACPLPCTHFALRAIQIASLSLEPCTVELDNDVSTRLLAGLLLLGLARVNVAQEDRHGLWHCCDVLLVGGSGNLAVQPIAPPLSPLVARRGPARGHDFVQRFTPHFNVMGDGPPNDNTHWEPPARLQQGACFPGMMANVNPGGQPVRPAKIAAAIEVAANRLEGRMKTASRPDTTSSLFLNTPMAPAPRASSGAGRLRVNKKKHVDDAMHLANLPPSITSRATNVTETLPESGASMESETSQQGSAGGDGRGGDREMSSVVERGEIMALEAMQLDKALSQNDDSDVSYEDEHAPRLRGDRLLNMRVRVQWEGSIDKDGDEIPEWWALRHAFASPASQVAERLPRIAFGPCSPSCTPPIAISLSW